MTIEGITYVLYRYRVKGRTYIEEYSDTVTALKKNTFDVVCCLGYGTFGTATGEEAMLVGVERTIEKGLINAPDTESFQCLK